jgi:hypothetical protein
MAMGTLTAGLSMSTVGLVSWVMTDRKSNTALIPVALGLPMALLSPLEAVPGARGPARALTTALALAAIGGTARALPRIPALLRGEPVERPIAVAAQALVFGVATLHLLTRRPR